MFWTEEKCIDRSKKDNYFWNRFVFDVGRPLISALQTCWMNHEEITRRQRSYRLEMDHWYNAGTGADFTRTVVPRQYAYIWSHFLQHEQDPHFLLDVHVFRRLPRGLLAVHPPFSRGSGSRQNKIHVTQWEHKNTALQTPRHYRLLKTQDIVWLNDN